MAFFDVYIKLFFFVLICFFTTTFSDFFYEKGICKGPGCKRLCSASLFLQRSEMWFHCCAHISMGAPPEIVVLIYEIITSGHLNMMKMIWQDIFLTA